MGFGYSKGSSNSGNSDGVFVDTVEIKRAVCYADEKHPQGKFDIDFGLELFYDVKTKNSTFENSVLITIPWDWMEKFEWKLQRVFDRTGASYDWEPTADKKVPEEALRDLVGRSMNVLRYRTTKSTTEKLRTTAWDMIDSVDGDINTFKAEFFRGVERGYPKNYQGSSNSAQVSAAASQEEYLPF
jgi:hypothetical protein